MRCIMVIGRQEDPCCQLLLRTLQQKGRDTLWLPEDQIFPGMDFTWAVSQASSHGSVKYGGTSARFDALDGVLARFYGIAVSPEVYTTKDGQYISAEWNALMMAWIHSLECRVINRLKPELWYKTSLNLPSLMALLPDLNLLLPRTLVTTSFVDARTFYLRCDRRAGYMPLTQDVPYSLETEEQLARLETLMGTLPFQLIQRPEGEPCEALVVGNEVVVTDKAGRRNTHISPSVQEACRKIARNLGLAFCQISLVLDCDGAAWCMGANRMPQIYGLQPEVQNEIAEHLADLLVRGERSANT